MKIERQADKIILKPDEKEQIKEVIIYTLCELKSYKANIDSLGRLHITIR
jgi:hypothetical protein